MKATAKHAKDKNFSAGIDNPSMQGTRVHTTPRQFAVMISVSPLLWRGGLLASGTASPVPPTTGKGGAAWPSRKQSRTQPGIIKDFGCVCSMPKPSPGFGFNLNPPGNVES